VCALYHYHCTHGYRAHRPPGIPCALNSERAGINEHLAKKPFGEIAKVCRLKALVMPGLDPGIHRSSQEHFSKKMDCRVKPGNDEMSQAV
jgi:hypothetical protein